MKKTLGGICLFTINLDGGTITPLINEIFGSIYPPHN